MKPAWNDLGSEYAGSAGVVIGDVDCTEHQDVCSRFGVSGYPTIKYFTDETGEEGAAYNGGRSLDDLQKFTQDTLEPKCDPAAPEGCTEKEQKYIAKQAGKSPEDLQAQVDRLNKMKGSSMKPELKAWLMQRLRILNKMLPAEKEEL